MLNLFNSISGVKQGDNLTLVLFLFVVQSTIETMHDNWSTISIETPDLNYFPSENNGYLSKRSNMKSAPLYHNVTSMIYADNSSLIFS
jgi:hypothetical protein